MFDDALLWYLYGSCEKKMSLATSECVQTERMPFGSSFYRIIRWNRIGSNWIELNESVKTSMKDNISSRTKYNSQTDWMVVWASKTGKKSELPTNHNFDRINEKWFGKYHLCSDMRKKHYHRFASNSSEFCLFWSSFFSLSLFHLLLTSNLEHIFNNCFFPIQRRFFFYISLFPYK